MEILYEFMKEITVGFEANIYIISQNYALFSCFVQ